MPHRDDHQAALARAAALEAENARLRNALKGDGLASANYRLAEAEKELLAVDAQIQGAGGTINGWWWAMLVAVGWLGWAAAFHAKDGEGDGVVLIMVGLGAFAVYRIADNSRPAKRAARREARETLKEQRAQLLQEIQDLHALFRAPDDAPAEP